MKRKFPVVLFMLFLATGLFIARTPDGWAHHPQKEQKVGEPTADLTFASGRPEAQKAADLILQLKDPQGAPLKNLAIHHDRILHVIIASEDFSVFAHLHPEDFGPISSEMIQNARFPLRFTFPRGGRYIMGVDFAHGSRGYSDTFLLEVAGEPKLGKGSKDLSAAKNFSDYQVKLSILSDRIEAGREATLQYHFARDGKPVNDLEPYLSAAMHLAVVSSDMNVFMHAHGDLPRDAPGHAHVAMKHGEGHGPVPARFRADDRGPSGFSGQRSLSNLRRGQTSEPGHPDPLHGHGGVAGPGKDKKNTPNRQGYDGLQREALPGKKETVGRIRCCPDE